MYKKKNKTQPIPIKDFESIAMCIRSDQVPASEVNEMWENDPVFYASEVNEMWENDPVFYKWYKQRYLTKKK